MAANTFSSRTSAYTGTTVTHPVTGSKEGAFILIKYTKGNGTSITVIPSFIFKKVSATDQYSPVIIDSVTPTLQTYTFSTGGPTNYQIPIGLAKGVSTLKVDLTFTGGTTADVVCDIVIQ